MPKYIFVTGGVVSSLGKGIVAASIGLLLKSRGFSVANQKLDPYLNVDPGMMDPKEHGEVYVTKDGYTTDLDLGYYERFTGVETNENSSYSAGKIYNNLFREERKGGKYAGKTVQVIPHLVDEIRVAIKSAGNENTDVVIVEIGGTVGDIEGLPFLEALRIFRQKEGFKNTFFIHCTLIPYLRKAREIKTKPTQHSVAELRRIGIIPDMLVCRVEEKSHLDDNVREKLGLFCNVDTNSVLGSFDYEHTIYEIPISLGNQNIDTQILDYFGLPSIQLQRQTEEWTKYIKNSEIASKTDAIKIALIGKHTSVPDAYKSIEESLIHTGVMLKRKINVELLSAEELEKQGNAEELLKNADGILVADTDSDGKKGNEGEIAAIKFARENNVPFFGICLGMQMAIVEFSRNVLHIDTQKEKDIFVKSAAMRLGTYPCKIKNDTLTAKLYGEEEIFERHRRRYEFNNEFKDVLEKNGIVFSGILPDEQQLAEIIELPKHPYFVGVQFHPEFKSRPIKPHPLFMGFIEAAIKKVKE
jgi:CTP synthase